MSEVTKADIIEVHRKIEGVHKRIDEGVKCNTKIQVSLAKIETNLEALIIPEQPCRFLNTHIGDHKSKEGVWHSTAVRTTIDLIKMAIVAGATWLFVRKN